MNVNGKIEPLRNLLLVVEHKPKTQSLIVTPDTARQEYKFHRVIDVGPGVVRDGKLIEVRIPKGAIILVSGPAMDMGAGRSLVSEDHVVAIIHDEEAAS